MDTLPTILFAIVLGAGVQPASRWVASTRSGPEDSQSSPQSAPKATIKTAAATAPDAPFGTADAWAEQELLALANESRKQAGARPLTLDGGLSQAARTHARAMVDAQQLSHQFAGELSLPQRLAVTTNLQLDQEGENVAYDYDAEHGHEHLMHSPPHRANLLNPDYNVIGLGVVRSGERLYIVEDFGHALPSYSADEVKDRIAATVIQARRQAHQPDLQRLDQIANDDAACSMAQADKLGTGAVRALAGRSTVLSYTSPHPETLPSGGDRAIASHNLKTFSIGTCYARTATYPTGVYWVVLLLN